MDAGGDGVGNDLRELLAVGVEVRQQDGRPGASRVGDRKRRAERDVGVPVGDLRGEERAVEEPQELSAVVQRRHVRVVGAHARRGAHGDELGDLGARRRQRQRSELASWYLDPRDQVTVSLNHG